MRLMVGKAMAVALTAGLLAACGDDGKRGANDDRTAAGEVRGGTISDEMLPLDQLKSQSPPLRTTSDAPVDAESEDATDGGEEVPGAEGAAPDPAGTE